MTWLVWRQHRAQGAITLALLAVFAIFIFLDGFAIASHWHSLLVACRADQNGGTIMAANLDGTGVTRKVLCMCCAPAVAGYEETGSGA